jgi:hypothetical protein
MIAEHDVLGRARERERAERRQSMTSISILRRGVGHRANLLAPGIGGKNFRVDSVADEQL